jgi:hypothetical protein
MGSPMFDMCGIQKVSRTLEVCYLIVPYMGLMARLKHAVPQQKSNF